MSEESVHAEESDEFHDPLAEYFVIGFAVAIPLFDAISYLKHADSPLLAILSAFASGLVAVAFWQKARPTELHLPSQWALLLTTTVSRVVFIIAGVAGVVYGIYLGTVYPHVFITAFALLVITTGVVAILLWRSFQ